MAVTMNNVRRIVAGNSVRIVGSITGPASYTTGGETLSAAQIAALTDGDSTTSLSNNLTFDSEVVPTSFRATVLDRTNKKLMFTTAFAEVANATNLSAVTINFESIVRVANQGAGKTV
jgi:hypothetical protein